MSHTRKRLAGCAAALAALVVVCIGVPAATASTATAFPFGSSYLVLASPKNSGITPASGWQNISFSEAGWTLKSAPFGSNDGCQPIPAASALPKNGTLYVRKHFSLPVGASQLHLHLRIDSNVSVYVNGQSVYVAGDDNCGKAIRDVTVPDNLLVTGDNVVAIKADDNGAVSYLDVEATYTDTPAPPPPSPAHVA